MATVKNEKYARTVKLEMHLNDRLVALCEHLGVNVNAYLIAEIGKAVSRDEVAFNAKNANDEMLRLVSEAVQQGVSLG